MAEVLSEVRNLKNWIIFWLSFRLSSCKCIVHIITSSHETVSLALCNDVIDSYHDLIYYVKLKTHLSVYPFTVFGMLITLQSLINQNGTCLKWRLCLWRSEDLFLQAYRTHDSSTGVHKRQWCKQPLTHQLLASGLSPTYKSFYFS